MKRIKRNPLKIIGWSEDNKPIYEHRKICQYCNKEYKNAHNRANHELHYCKSNPDVQLLHKTIKITTETTLIQTRTYTITKKTVSQILSRLPLNIHYEIYDKPTGQIFPLRQAIK